MLSSKRRCSWIWLIFNQIPPNSIIPTQCGERSMYVQAKHQTYARSKMSQSKCGVFEVRVRTSNTRSILEVSLVFWIYKFIFSACLLKFSKTTSWTRTTRVQKKWLKNVQDHIIAGCKILTPFSNYFRDSDGILRKVVI